MVNIQKVIETYVKRQRDNQIKFRESRQQLLIIRQQVDKKKRGNILLGSYQDDMLRK